MTANRVRIDASPVPFMVVPALVPLLLLTVLVVPSDEREGSNGEVLLATLGVTLLVVVLSAWGWWRYGGNCVVADDSGVEVCSRQSGDRRLAWDELSELGWASAGPVKTGGLACRTIAGGAYDVPGPNLVGWLTRPAGRVRPPERDDLRALAEAHGVTWREWSSAEVTG